MATNMDKSFYQTPLGMEDEAETPLDIEIINPEMVTLDDGSVEITITPGEEDMDEGGFSENLAEKLKDNVLSTLSGDLMALFDSDVTSRKEWVEAYIDGIELLGLKYEERTEPW